MLPTNLHFLRQLTDESGAVTLAKSYRPYGDVLSSNGSAVSRYGYTGEWTDASGMVYLRARYYSPWDGRFVSRDTWAGDAQQPMSYNGWLYGYGNPVLFTDPSGMIPRPESICDRLPPDDAYWCRKALECKYGTPSPAPTPELPSPPLTQKGREAYELYRAYLEYTGDNGWWKTDGDFTVEEFLGMWIRVQANVVEKKELLVK